MISILFALLLLTFWDDERSCRSSGSEISMHNVIPKKCILRLLVCDTPYSTSTTWPLEYHFWHVVLKEKRLYIVVTWAVASSTCPRNWDAFLTVAAVSQGNIKENKVWLLTIYHNSNRPKDKTWAAHSFLDPERKSTPHTLCGEMISDCGDFILIAQGLKR